VRPNIGFLGLAAALGLFLLALPGNARGAPPSDTNAQLMARLQSAGFTGRVESTLPVRLGRQLDPPLANVGRALWFDTITGLNGDNTCGGCHSPTNGFGDAQSIAIGIDNNRIVGPGRTGPRNMRRAPMVLNTAFFPTLMWNARFTALSGDPFNNHGGFAFPAPESMSLSREPHLLVAQAFIPPTERTEAAGFAFAGDNDAIRAEVVRRLNQLHAYRRLFGESFPSVRAGAPIDYDMFARAVSEFEFALTFADAPIDHFARGESGALTDAEKRGALLFFGKAGCAGCHAVAGAANEMFTDFRTHAIGVPQLVPARTNNQFDGPFANEDFGREDFTGSRADRYQFRTPSLRNVAVEAAFMHDGAFTSLSDAVLHHLDVRTSLLAYEPAEHGIAQDLRAPIDSRAPLLNVLDPLLRSPTVLSDAEFKDLLAFVRDGLLDPRARPDRLRGLVPRSVPSGSLALIFQFDLASTGAASTAAINGTAGQYGASP
jgi:cytochrome c peroxidase